MNCSRPGQFYGKANETLHLNGIILYYGYLFWNRQFNVAGKQLNAFYCAGNGGNSIFIFPDQPWVVVITASAYGAGYAHPQVAKMMTTYILPALLNK